MTSQYTRRGATALGAAGLVVASIATTANAAPEHKTLQGSGTKATAFAEAGPEVNAGVTAAVSAADDVEYGVNNAALFGDLEVAAAPEPEPEPEPEPQPEPEVEPEPETVEREEATASRDEQREAAPAQSQQAAAPEQQQAPAAAPASATGNQIVNIARQYVGTPYVWGSTNPAVGLDCATFTHLVYSQVGINLPLSSSAQGGAGTRIPASEARPGDLMWWPGHVAIYTGNGMHIAAWNPGTPLHEAPVSNSGLGAPTYIRVTG